jgi:putative endonuclease
MTNKKHTVHYNRMTNNLIKRVHEHNEKGIGGFTKRYNVSKLVYYEVKDTALSAISREKQIRAGSRQKKIDLINKLNPEWLDLYETIM